ncbi:site-specific DNA-methyltransferase [candidate division WOR-3 bacterium]|nr:site-specific DNA-methyltransferase [candidate division WOR-3 bacterium]
MNRVKLKNSQRRNSYRILNGLPFDVIRQYGQLAFDKWFNQLVLGDNLIVLKNLLQIPQVKGKVRLIYIDPPFSTNQTFRVGEKRTSTISPSNQDKEAYVDRLRGKDYLNFLRVRLSLLRELLADDGTIYVHIDYKIGHYVKVMMDEVFGKNHFINDITRIKCNPKNFPRKGYGNIKDMILFYSKSSEYVLNEPRVKMTDEDIIRLFPKIDKYGRRYTTTPVHAPGETRNGRTGKPWRGLFPPKGRHWRVSPEELDKLDQEGHIEWSSTGNPRRIIYADEKIRKGKLLQDIWNFKDPQYPKYPTEKNLEMLKLIVEASSKPNDIVLDCFVGSGSTLFAAELTGRRWIGIDSSKTAIEIAEDRLKTIKKASHPFAILELTKVDL